MCCEHFEQNGKKKEKKEKEKNEENEEVMLKTKLQNNQGSESISATGFKSRHDSSNRLH